MPTVGFEPAIPAVEWPQTYALDCTATGIRCLCTCISLPDADQHLYQCFCQMWGPCLTLGLCDVINHTQHRASKIVPADYAVFINLSVHKQVSFKTRVHCYCGVRGGRGTALQPGRSRVLFPMGSLRFFINIIPPAALWPWDRLSL